MDVWKVCRERESSFTSCYAQPPYRLEYKEDEWTEAPEGTGLFVFEKRSWAEKFAEEHQSTIGGLLVIFRAEAEEVTPAPQWILKDTWRQDDVKKLWETENWQVREKFYDWWIMSVPEGTVLCQKLRLIERV